MGGEFSRMPGMKPELEGIEDDGNDIEKKHKQAAIIVRQFLMSRFSQPFQSLNLRTHRPDTLVLIKIKPPVNIDVPSSKGIDVSALRDIRGWRFTMRETDEYGNTAEFDYPYTILKAPRRIEPSAALEPLTGPRRPKPNGKSKEEYQRELKAYEKAVATANALGPHAPIEDVFDHFFGNLPFHAEDASDAPRRPHEVEDSKRSEHPDSKTPDAM